MPNRHHDVHHAPGITLKRLPLRKAAVCFIGAVWLCLCGLLYLQLDQSRSHDLSLAQVASTNLTRAMAQQAEDTFMKADLVLTSLVDLIQMDGAGPQQLERLQKTFARRVLTLDQLHGILLFDRNGQWVVTSFESLPRGPGVADREYFKFHQQNVTSVAHIGPAIRSRENGEWIIPISKRINDKDGNFQGVLLAGIKMSYFDQFFKSFSLDDKGSMFLGLTDGTLLARRPFVESQIGTSVAQSEIFKNLLPQANSGSAMFTSSIDGVTRMYGYRQLEAYPLVVTAASSIDTILAGWYDTAFRSSIIVALVLVGVGLFGWVFIYQVRVGEQVEKDLRRAQEALELIATHDSLTGLANRRLFERALDIEFGRGARQVSPLSLIMLDIDYFKRYNDTYGHVVGDHCLAEVARALKSCCHRKADLAVRYGGEEFAVLLPDTDIHGAMTIAEQIRRSVIDKNISHSGSPNGYVTVSLGCYSFVPSGRDSMDVFIQRADAALYQAKHSGRNRVASLSTESSVETLMRSDR
ncbi:diguanylate cyclase (GGDEF) domain-containing protein [Pseudomonas vancouverensis]|uniref:diguanylate cyclase n=1 Tax=Pseudomonas vancouverensis TaxID=95300 RepID=A0A1H2MR68_PSEVA|nr:GGDEF domain-containing protein [Pseudomonas vancouverensis]KAB0494521.1 diguanylate cyclase [Pseudomonas vancouverensis]TDB59187.1 diguanylate cyclase [Pseudomonas vancouverensis]SDU95719.1 diguanylate cyclase (GGDEF) domain-containing protein [Pseudomonas vancouverensis]